MKSLRFSFVMIYLVSQLLGSSTTFAQGKVVDEKIISYTGQADEKFDLAGKVKVKVTETIQVDSTCIKKEAYTVNECHDETRTREECQTIPAHEECRNVDDVICRDVTRYREECRTIPGREVCDRTPTREVCSNQSQRVCTNVPRTERVCTNGPGRRVCDRTPERTVCRTDPKTGKEVCGTVGGVEVCRTLPGEEVCRNVTTSHQECRDENRRVCSTVGGDTICRRLPDDRDCRQVPYQDRDCNRTTRRVCDNIPAERVCKQVPYKTEQVCGPVTKYKDVSYACKKDQQVDRVVEKEEKLPVNIYFANSTKTLVQLKATLTEDRKITLSLVDPKIDVYVIKKIDAARKGYLISFLGKDQVPSQASPVRLENLKLSKSKKELEFTLINHGLNYEAKVDLSLVKKKSFLSKARLVLDLKNEDFKTSKVLMKSSVTNGTLVKIPLSGSIKKKTHEINLSVRYQQVDGEILNGPIGTTFLQQKVLVKGQK